MDQYTIEKLEDAICQAVPDDECRTTKGRTCKECLRDYAFKIYEINNKENINGKE